MKVMRLVVILVLSLVAAGLFAQDLKDKYTGWADMWLRLPTEGKLVAVAGVINGYQAALWLVRVEIEEEPENGDVFGVAQMWLNMVADEPKMNIVRFMDAFYRDRAHEDNNLAEALICYIYAVLLPRIPRDQQATMPRA